MVGLLFPPVAEAWPTCEDTRCPIEQPAPVPAPEPPAVFSPSPPSVEPPDKAPARGLNLTSWGPWETLTSTAVVATYHHVGVRERVQTMLAQRRATGETAIRIMVWHMDSGGGHTVPTSLPHPYPDNIRNVLVDIKVAGFEWVEVAFGPQWRNDPIADVFDPSALERNWQLMVKVHAIAESVLPGTVLYDLQNEGGSHPGIAHRVDPYVREVWDRWEAAFGLSRTTVSFHSGRWTSLQTALDPDPLWWEVHVYDQHGAPFSVPPDNKPVVIGETYMDEYPLPDPRVTATLWWPVGRS
jgi:hypothetical protein